MNYLVSIKYEFKIKGDTYLIEYRELDKSIHAFKDNKPVYHLYGSLSCLDDVKEIMEYIMEMEREAAD
jgi:hypothetical protein